MNINAIVTSQLRKQEAALVTKLEGVRAALAAFGGSVSAAPISAATRTRKKRRTKAQIDAIKKAQDARAAKFAAKKAQDGQTQTAGGQGQAARESKPRLPVGSRDVPRGASLAEAAS